MKSMMTIKLGFASVLCLGLVGAVVHAAEIHGDGLAEFLRAYGITRTNNTYVCDMGNGIRLTQRDPVIDSREVFLNFRIDNNSSGGVFEYTVVNQIFRQVGCQLTNSPCVSSLGDVFGGANPVATLSLNQDGVNKNGRYTVGSSMGADGTVTLNGVGLGVIPFAPGEYIAFSISFKKDIDGDGRPEILAVDWDPTTVFSDAVTGVHGEDSWSTSALSYRLTVYTPPTVALTNECLHFVGVEDTTYSILSCAELTTNCTWSVVTNVTATAAGTLEVEVDCSAPQAFFRVERE